MKFKTWKTIKLGTGLKTPADFRRALKSSGCEVGRWGADAILDSPAFVVSLTEIQVKLVIISVAELGLHGEKESWNDRKLISFEEIYSCAQELNLGICSIEVGPQLRLQYLEQPVLADEWINIGMKPIKVKPHSTTETSENLIFTLSHHDKKGKLGLAAGDGSPRRLFSHANRFVFIHTETTS